MSKIITKFCILSLLTFLLQRHKLLTSPYQNDQLSLVDFTLSKFLGELSFLPSKFIFMGSPIYSHCLSSKQQRKNHLYPEIPENYSDETEKHLAEAPEKSPIA